MESLEILLKKYYKHILLAIFLVAVFLRWLYLPQNAISFAYDQARDAFVVSDLLQGNIKILGPSVSGVPGLYHGVLYYYVIALPYLVGGGDPIYVAYFLSFISSLVVFAVFYLSYSLTKKFTPSITASLIFAFSYESVQYSNLLTNASMGVWFVPLIYISILIGSPILLGLSFGLAVQSEVALLYHLVPIIFLTFNKFSVKKYFFTFSSFLISASTMLISEVKFGFSGSKGMLYLLTGGDGISNTKQLSDYFITLINQLGLSFSYTLFPINVVLGGIVGFAMIWFLRKELTVSKVLFLYIFAFAFGLPMGGWNMKHLLVGISPAIAVMAGVFIWKMFSKNYLMIILTLFIILISNLYKVIGENVKGQTIFPLQKDLVLSKEIEVIKNSYQESMGESFSVSTLTSPLYVNTLWAYLYKWYGEEKYGYLPTFLGKDQIGQVGNVLKNSKKDERWHFYIEEPTYGIPEIYVQYARGDEDSYSKLVKSMSFGEIVLQKREYYE